MKINRDEITVRRVKCTTNKPSNVLQTPRIHNYSGVKLRLNPEKLLRQNFRDMNRVKSFRESSKSGGDSFKTTEPFLEIPGKVTRPPNVEIGNYQKNCQNNEECNDFTDDLKPVNWKHQKLEKTFLLKYLESALFKYEKHSSKQRWVPSRHVTCPPIDMNQGVRKAPADQSKTYLASGIGRQCKSSTQTTKFKHKSTQTEGLSDLPSASSEIFQNWIRSSLIMAASMDKAVKVGDLRPILELHSGERDIFHSLVKGVYGEASISDILKDNYSIDVSVYFTEVTKESKKEEDLNVGMIGHDDSNDVDFLSLKGISSRKNDETDTRGVQKVIPTHTEVLTFDKAFEKLEEIKNASIRLSENYCSAVTGIQAPVVDRISDECVVLKLTNQEVSEGPKIDTYTTTVGQSDDSKKLIETNVSETFDKSRKFEEKSDSYGDIFEDVHLLGQIVAVVKILCDEDKDWSISVLDCCRWDSQSRDENVNHIMRNVFDGRLQKSHIMTIIEGVSNLADPIKVESMKNVCTSPQLLSKLFLEMPSCLEVITLASGILELYEDERLQEEELKIVAEFLENPMFIRQFISVVNCINIEQGKDIIEEYHREIKEDFVEDREKSLANLYKLIHILTAYHRANSSEHLETTNELIDLTIKGLEVEEVDPFIRNIFNSSRLLSTIIVALINHRNSDHEEYQLSAAVSNLESTPSVTEVPEPSQPKGKNHRYSNSEARETDIDRAEFHDGPSEIIATSMYNIKAFSETSERSELSNLNVKDITSLIEEIKKSTKESILAGTDPMVNLCETNAQYMEIDILKTIRTKNDETWKSVNAEEAARYSPRILRASSDKLTSYRTNPFLAQKLQSIDETDSNKGILQTDTNDYIGLENITEINEKLPTDEFDEFCETFSVVSMSSTGPHNAEMFNFITKKHSFNLHLDDTMCLIDANLSTVNDQQEDLRRSDALREKSLMGEILDDNHRKTSNGKLLQFNPPLTIKSEGAVILTLGTESPTVIPDGHLGHQKTGEKTEDQFSAFDRKDSRMGGEWEATVQLVNLPDPVRSNIDNTSIQTSLEIVPYKKKEIVDAEYHENSIEELHQSLLSERDHIPSEMSLCLISTDIISTKMMKIEIVRPQLANRESSDVNFAAKSNEVAVFEDFQNQINHLTMRLEHSMHIINSVSRELQHIGTIMSGHKVPALDMVVENISTESAIIKYKEPHEDNNFQMTRISTDSSMDLPENKNIHKEVKSKDFGSQFDSMTTIQEMHQEQYESGAINMVMLKEAIGGNEVLASHEGVNDPPDPSIIYSGNEGVSARDLDDYEPETGDFYIDNSYVHDDNESNKKIVGRSTRKELIEGEDTSQGVCFRNAKTQVDLVSDATVVSLGLVLYYLLHILAVRQPGT